MAEVTRELDVQRFLDRSVKTALALDRTDADAKLGGLSELVAAVGRVLEAADSCQNESPRPESGQPGTPTAQADEPPDKPVDGDDGPGGGGCATLAGEVETLRAVVERDVERDAEGAVVGIVQWAADVRISSMTDPTCGTGARALRRSSPDSKFIARMARPSERGRLPRDAFALDFERAELTCPAGHVPRRTRYASQRGEKAWLFQCGHERCGPCP